MKAIIFTPSERGVYHLGISGLDDTSDLLHSDTLFSALANVYAAAFGSVSGFIEAVASGKMRFSSGLPSLLYAGQLIPALPRPPIEFRGTERGKRGKAVRFLSLGVWREVCASYDHASASCDIDLLAYPAIGSTVVLPEEIGGVSASFSLPSVWRVVDFPKVKVHTRDSKDRIYYETVLQSTPVSAREGVIRGCFVVFVDHSLPDTEWIDFVAAVRIMGDEGIGGQRSSGRGQFDTVEVTDINIPSPAAGIHHLGLSLLSPCDNQEFHDRVFAYDLVRRGGGTIGRSGAGDKHRKQVRMIREGALLASDVKGQVIDISPASDGSILRNGMNFSIPIGGMQ